jgi:hypothetical protein
MNRISFFLFAASFRIPCVSVIVDPNEQRRGSRVDNDPTTGAWCEDPLSRQVIRGATRAEDLTVRRENEGEMRLFSIRMRE